MATCRSQSARRSQSRRISRSGRSPDNTRIYPIIVAFGVRAQISWITTGILPDTNRIAGTIGDLCDGRFALFQKAIGPGCLVTVGSSGIYFAIRLVIHQSERIDIRIASRTVVVVTVAPSEATRRRPRDGVVGIGTIVTGWITRSGRRTEINRDHGRTAGPVHAR